MDTAQNTTNTPVRFNYPDFSQGTASATPPTPPQSQPSTSPVITTPVPTPSDTNTQATTNYVDQKKLDELKQSINELLDTPVDTTQEEKKEPPMASTQSSTVVDTSEQTSYVQKPTPLPNMEKTKIASTPIGENLIQESLVAGIKASPLESIMPKSNRIKALERSPKENNLAAPHTSTKGSIEVEGEKSSATISSNSDKFAIDELLAEVISKNASDLHISVGYPPTIRIDGVLVNVGEKIITPKDSEELVLSVLSDDKKELLDVNREIDFAYSFTGDISARFRVNAYYSMQNLSAAFRLIPTRVRTIEELMLPQIYHQITKLRQGLVLVTGPTGHGKSTTLAALLEDINRTRSCHIVTIEDPVEYIFEGKKAVIDQREMNDDTHSWNIALRSALRQDPDVILVGEMRDYETIAAVITLAETGHLVFATLHTNSASQTIDRIIDVFPENQQQQVRTQIANTLQVVVSQRLVPLEKGGRRAVSEIMFNTSAVANLIREGKAHQIDNVIRTSSDVGMSYLERELVNLVREGVITSQKAQEFALRPEEVIRLLNN